MYFKLKNNNSFNNSKSINNSISKYELQSNSDDLNVKNTKKEILGKFNPQIEDTILYDMNKRKLNPELISNKKNYVRRLNEAKSKIKNQIMQDKSIFIKSYIIPNNGSISNNLHFLDNSRNPSQESSDKYSEWKYDNKNNNYFFDFPIYDNDLRYNITDEFPAVKKEFKRSVDKGGKINYMISYDRNLRPEKIKTNSREKYSKNQRKIFDNTHMI